MSYLAELNRRWSVPAYPPIPVSAADVASAEGALSFAFPGPYREAVLAVGLPRVTADLWDDIEASGVEMAHLADFLTPEETISTTQDDRSGGMPADLVAFACDSGGNVFVFREDAMSDAVWVFDHDFGTVKQVAPSFEAWLKAYCDLPKRLA